MKKDIIKQPHGAGGFTLMLTEKEGNTRFGDTKKKVIIEALQASDTEGVYITTNNQVVRQLLNGSKQFL
jgi:hypothetical protein